MGLDYYDRMHFIKRLTPLILSLMTLVSLSNSSAAQEPTPSSALDGQLFYEILLGELSTNANDPGAGFSLMLDAARKTQDAGLYRRAVQIALQSRSGSSALMAAKAWNQAEPDSAEANRFLLQILLGLNRPKEALEPLRRAIELASDSEKDATIWSITGIFEHASDKRLAAQTVEQALSSVLLDRELGPTAWATVGRLWLNADDPGAALDALAKGQSLGAGSERLALVALTMMDESQPRAEALVTAYLPIAQPPLRMAYIKSLLNKQRLADALAQLKTLLQDAPEHADAWLIQGLLSLGLGQWEEAQNQLKTYLSLVEADAHADQHPEFKRGRTQAFFGLSQIAQKRKDWLQADAWLQRVNNPEDALRANIKRAQILAEQDQIDQALALLDQHAVNSVEEMRLKRGAMIQLLRDHKLYARAKALLTQTLKKEPGDTDSMYELAMVYERLDDLAEMENLLRQLIALKPDDASAYNALGYSLADRGQRLAEAKQLIEKALSLSPKDPFIMDSLGWAEYRIGNQKIAIGLLQDAFKARPDAEIAAHLGEVLWMNQQRDQAIEVFKQGLKLNPGNEALNETIKRLNVTL